MDQGADVSRDGCDRRTALHAAARNGHGALAQLLVYRGTDVSAADRHGWTPLHVAGRNRHEALALLLATSPALPRR